MTYRDDRDADRARVEALELELARARERIEELEGRRSTALVAADRGAVTRAGASPRPGAAARWLGGPIELGLERDLAGSFPVDRFEDIIERVREIVREPGRSEILKTSLTWSASAGSKSTGPFTVVSVSVRDGRTRVMVSDRLGALVGALYGGVGGGVGGGAIILPILATAAAPLLAPLVFGVWVGGIYAGTRALFQRASRRRAVQLQQVFDAVCAEVERGIAAGAP